MPRRLPASLLLLLIPLAVWAGDRPWTLDAIMELKTVSDPQISPDGEQVAYVVRSESRERNAYDSQIRIVDAAGKSDLPLAGSHYSDRSPRWAPDGRRLALLSNRGGNSQVYVSDPTEGGMHKVTNAATGVGRFLWSADGKQIAYLSVDPIRTEEAARIKAGDDPIVRGESLRYSRIYVIPAKGGKSRLITTDDHHVLSFDWSPDGSKMAYAAQKTPENRWAFHVDLHEIDLETGQSTPLVTQEGRDANPSYSPDGKWVAFHTQGGTLNYFAERDVALAPSGGGHVQPLRRFYSGDVFRGGDRFWWSDDGSRLIFGVGQGTRSFAYEVDRYGRRLLGLAFEYSYRSGFSISRDRDRIAFVPVRNHEPPEVALGQVLSPSSMEVRSLSSLNSQAVQYPSLKTETIWWTSKDGSRVEGVLRYPMGYEEGKPVPLLVELHGGPTGVAMEGYPVPRTYATQLFAQHGFAVLAPNFRGSSNYGARWRLKNIESQGFGDFDDVMTGVDHLIEKGIADPDRLGVMGWSYGGYLTSWVIGHTDRFKAASIGAPATDWITYYGEFNGALEVLWTYFGGNPWDAAANYIRHSSRNGLAKDAKTPSLLLRGENDFDHNPEIYQILRDRGVPVRLVTYPREGHGIREPMHQRDMMKRNLRWFRKWVLGEETAGSP